MLCFRNGTRWAMNLSDRVAKAERGSKTLRDHMKEQHMLSKIAEIEITSWVGGACGIFARVGDVSEISLARCARSFDF